MQAGRGYYVEVRTASHKGRGQNGKFALKLCLLDDGQNADALPSDVGAANYHYESLESGMRAARSFGGEEGTTGLFDLTCAPGFMDGHNPINATRVAEFSAGWGGSHAISPVPASFFRSNYTPSAEEESFANRTDNVVEEGAPGVGSWGGTCTCPNGIVYDVGDNNDGCTTLACIGGVSGETCSNRGGLGAHVRVTCGPHAPLLLPPSPPAPPPLSFDGITSMWGTTQPNGAAALTDGATHGCRGGVSDAETFWGFRGDSADAVPDFGSGCASAEGELIGTPCAPGVAPSRRYNYMFVRSGAVGQAGRVGLAQRLWSFDTDAEASELYAAAGLPEQAVSRDPNTFTFDSKPQISQTAIAGGAFPVFRNPTLYSAPSKVNPTGFLKANLAGRKYLQVSSGYFKPPVTGVYQFSVYCRSDAYGDAYVLLSSDADPVGSYFAAYGNHYHDQTLSRWMSLQKDRLYYFEFWQGAQQQPSLQRLAPYPSPPSSPLPLLALRHRLPSASPQPPPHTSPLVLIRLSERRRLVGWRLDERRSASGDD